MFKVEHFTKYGLAEGDDLIEDVPEPDEIPAIFHEDSIGKRGAEASNKKVAIDKKASFFSFFF